MRDAGDADFEAVVLDRSRAVPVLVDFWAPWCGPCRALGPVLERVAEEQGDRLDLVKINVDENPGVAARYGVRGIPAVKLFFGGELAAEFVGALPEGQVRAFLEEHLPSEAGKRSREAALRLAAGDEGGAREAALAALAADPGPGPTATADLVLARLALTARDPDGAVAHGSAVPASAPEWEAAQAVVEAAELARRAEAAGNPTELLARIAAEPPGTPEDVFALAIHRYLDGEPRAALEDLLGLVERDRRFGDDAARRAMLTIFSLVGVRSELADEFRRRLAILI